VKNVPILSRPTFDRFAIVFPRRACPGFILATLLGKKRGHKKTGTGYFSDRLVRACGECFRSVGSAIGWLDQAGGECSQCDEPQLSHGQVMGRAARRLRARGGQQPQGRTGNTGRASVMSRKGLVVGIPSVLESPPGGHEKCGLTMRSVQAWRENHSSHDSQRAQIRLFYSSWPCAQPLR
jgi:hypothetical protein